MNTRKTAGLRGQWERPNMLRLLRRLLLALPPPGSAAWEDESAFRDGKADFIRRNKPDFFESEAEKVTVEK